MDVYIQHLETKPIIQDHCRGWVDLRAAEDVDLVAGDLVNLSLGIRIDMSESIEAVIMPRKNTYSKWGIIIPSGSVIISSDYDKVWKVPILAMRDTHIYKDDKIVQFRFQETQPSIRFINESEVASLDR